MSPLRIVLLALALALGFLPAAAHAAVRAPETVVQDDALFLHGSDDEIRTGLTQAYDVGIRRVRLTAGWSVIAPSPASSTVPDGDLTDPAAYPAENWANLDRAVRLTVEAGMRPMIDIAFWAPRWATSGQADETTRLRTQIDPTQYARFAEAVARRYAGGYVPPVHPPVTAPSEPRPDADLLQMLLGRRRPPITALPVVPTPEPLPAVDLYTIWNEPNHPGFLLPQWRREDGRYVPASPDIYREMVYAAYPAIKRGAPASRVLIGGTASGGSSTPGRSGVPPLLFLRRLACVDDRLRPVQTGACADFRPLPGDGWAHHPYSLRTLPDALPKDPDKLPVAATGRLTSTLRRLVAEGRLDPADATVYMTEYGYETNPPDPQAPFSPEQQGRLLAWAEYLATRDPAVVMWPQFQLYDRPGDPAGPQMRAFGDWQTGLFYADGTPKPAYAQFGTPSVALCHRRGGRRWVEIWGRVRGADGPATVDVQARGPDAAIATAGGGWRTVASSARAALRGATAADVRPVAPGAPVTRFLRWHRGMQVRLHWRVDGGQDREGAALTAPACGRSPRQVSART